MLFCLLGRMRSGTTVLRNLIGSAPDIGDLKEVFYGDVNKPSNYWCFLYERAKENPNAILPSRRSVIWSEFIERESLRRSTRHLIFDMKIDGLSEIMSFDGINARLFPLDGVDRVIYVERRNILAGLISKRIAASSNTWFQFAAHAKLTENEQILAERARRLRMPEPDRIRIDPHVLLSEIMWVERQNKIVVDMFAHRISMRVIYEDMFDADGQFRRNLAEQLAEVTATDVNDFDLRPRYVKQGDRAPLDRIENTDEIVAYLSPTPYAWMLTAT